MQSYKTHSGSSLNLRHELLVFWLSGEPSSSSNPYLDSFSVTLSADKVPHYQRLVLQYFMSFSKCGVLSRIQMHRLARRHSPVAKWRRREARERLACRSSKHEVALLKHSCPLTEGAPFRLPFTHRLGMWMYRRSVFYFYS